MTLALQLQNLSKTFGSKRNQIQAVQALNLDVEVGQVYGFLGSNGAGKSTTIRMILNLVRPSSGTTYVFGQNTRQSPNILRSRVGALVEEATFYPYMTGYDNLRLIAHMHGISDQVAINSALERVGMSAFAGRKTRHYSTGMKQRLGIAATLIHDPDLLILDEPTSGLDPKGIQDVRDMLQSLAKNDGKTVFLSSHLLHEVEQICDRIAIINKGQLIQEGSISDLLQIDTVYHFGVFPLQKAHETLSQTFNTIMRDNHLKISAKRDEIPHIVQLLVSHDIQIYDIVPRRRTLEDLFLEVTHD